MRNVEDMASAALESSEAFGLFRQSATNAFGAIIQGGAGVSKALRKFLGDIILGKAFDAFTDALLASGKALIFAFTPGAQGNAIAAAKAAAANFAIAATLGGIAKRFGASGSLPGGGGRGRADIGPVTNTRGVGTGGDRGDTFIFAGGVESEIERARKFRRAQRRAVESTDDGPALLEAS